MRINMLRAAIVTALLVPTAAMATNGYFSHGYGIKSKGMAGVGIALPQDSLAAATNPAGMVMVGNRLDVGVDWFRPIRSSEITGNAMLGPSYNMDGNDSKNFFVPEFGYNKMLSPTMSVGVTVYGNGGMNTDYKSGVPLFGTGKAGVNLEQLFIAPSFAMKLTPAASCGVAVNMVYQRFKADGLQNFAGSSSAGANLTNQGNDSATGFGARIGCIGEVMPNLTLGATYQTKTAMGKFDKYKGLFAQQGDFDIPENYGIGVAFKATPTLTVAADLQQIKYSGVKAVANPVANLFAGNPLGSDNGPGFGWKDMTVFKLGANWQMNPQLTLRAGYSHGKQPIQSGETLFNVLAPGVIEDHLTLGATYAVNPTMEVSVAYMHGFEKKVNGAGSIPPGAPPAGFGGGEANLKMYQDSLGVALGMKF